MELKTYSVTIRKTFTKETTAEVTILAENAEDAQTLAKYKDTPYYMFGPETTTNTETFLEVSLSRDLPEAEMPYQETADLDAG